MSRSGRFPVLLDEGTPVAAGDVFRRKRHRVIPFLSVLSPGAADAVVAEAARANGAVLLVKDKDFRRMVDSKR
jgi:predicted nucleic acid-binding protein